MHDPLSIHAITHQYLARHPAEEQRLNPFTDFLRHTAPDAYTSRQTLIGHVTTSAFLLSPDRTSLLLIHHRKLGRYLQPGGHVESDATLLASACREVREEVGIPADALDILSPNDEPLDIDPHRIPFHAPKNVPEHWHFDIRYIMLIRDPWHRQITIQQEEVAQFRWVELASSALRESLPDRVIAKITAASRVC